MTEAAASRWRPERCPITGHAFVAWVDGVPVYGNRLAAHTLPEGDEDGDLVFRRYDFRTGEWSGQALVGRVVLPASVNARRIDIKLACERRVGELLVANNIHLENARTARAAAEAAIALANRAAEEVARLMEENETLCASLNAAAAAADE